MEWFLWQNLVFMQLNVCGSGQVLTIRYMGDTVMLLTAEREQNIEETINKIKNGWKVSLNLYLLGIM